MQVEIIYSNQDALRLSYIAEDMASGIVSKLEPLVNQINQENARIIFHFGCKDLFVEVNASAQLKRSIRALLEVKYAA